MEQFEKEAYGIRFTTHSYPTLLGRSLQHFAVLSQLCGFYLHCDWLSNIPDENVTGLSEISYHYQTHFCKGACRGGVGACRSWYKTTCTDNQISYQYLGSVSSQEL